MRVLPFFKPKKGWHIAGTNLETDSGGGSYVLPTASADTLGGVKVGSNLSINDSGVLSSTIPTASAETLGGVKVGDGLAINAAGVLSTSGGGGGLDFSDTEHEVGMYGNRKLFSRTFEDSVSSDVSSADAWIGASSKTSFDNIIAFFGNFIDDNINVAVTRVDYQASNGNWHVIGESNYQYPSNGKVYLTIFYTKTGQ